MTDFNELKKRCEETRLISATVVDEFLIYYAAAKDKLDKEFDQRISRFKKIQQDLPGELVRRLKSQYIAHRIFKKGGLITKYLNHVALKDLRQNEIEYLRLMAVHSWKFSFSEIVSNPAPDFWMMEDIFTSEQFLLYSPAVSCTVSEEQYITWFNMVSFNGYCWQSYGPVAGYQTFDIDDIFFYATELFPDISSDEDLLENIELNPVPYMMLIAGSISPRIMNGSHEIVQLAGEGDEAPFDKSKFRDFDVEYASSVYRISHALFSDFPHLAELFYDEKSRRLILFASTEYGYAEMRDLLALLGYTIPTTPELRVHLPMIELLERAFGKKVEVNPFHKLFGDSDGRSEAIDMMIELTEMVIRYTNVGLEPDAEKIAEEIGVDVETAKKLIAVVMSKTMLL